MKRHNGIDALRIVSMLMVVILHTLNFGGVLENTTPLSSHYCLSWILEIACYCAVNCFALISGFVMYRSKPTVSRLLQLWLHVAFYTLLITGVFFLFAPDSRNLDSLIKACFPVSTKEYWYISSYFGLYLLTPLINLAIQNIDKKTFELLLLGFGSILLISGLLAPIMPRDPFVLDDGYSLIWLCMMYLAGAYIHKYDIAKKIKKRYASGLVLLMVSITFASKVIFSSLGLPVFDAFIAYSSPTIIVSGIALFLIFAQLEDIRPLQKTINLLAPASLGVYLIHAHPLVYQNLISGFSAGFTHYNPVVMLLLVLGASCGIYLLCSAIELGRIKLFALLKIKDLCSRIDHLIMSKLHSSESANRL